MTGASKVTILKLLADVGKACAEYQDKTLRNLKCRKVQCDEIWSFCYSKEKNVPDEHKGELGFGDVWTFTAICADSKLAPTWRVGKRTSETAYAFMSDLAGRMAYRIQLTTDANHAYFEAVDGAFGSEIDYGQLIKMYDSPSKFGESRYSPAKFVKTKKYRAIGNPNSKAISTSFVERQNLTMRMSIRRFTRLTNAFSKKVENLSHAVALHFMHYNFCRIHQSLRVTPAMEAGVTDHVWSIEEILALLKK